MTPVDDEQLPVDEPPPLAPGERKSAAAEMPRMPSRPPAAESPENLPRKKSSTLSAVVGVFVLIAGVLLCSLGNLIGPAAIAAVIFAFAGLHYLIWGWWLSKAIRRQVEDEQRE
ncbi:MAG: hypothetical protein VX257_05750 [Planctomycetota bacterium]|nr:hypothetical protein [Planctomycetota bacterium]